MHTFSPHIMFSDLQWLEDYSRHFRAQSDAQPLSPGTADKDFLGHLEKIKRDCAKGFPCALVLVERLILRLATTECTTLFIADTLHEIAVRAQDECISQRFFSVSSDKSCYCDGSMLFGEAAAAKFPSTSFDIEEAGKCLALDRSTACVFHLVRIMEIGLKALAGGLGIPYAPSWESYLRQIDAKIAEKHAKKSRTWKRDESFYRDVAGDLQLVKIAWRNPTMHIVRKYTPEEAEDMFRAVRAFMNRLSSKLQEGTRTRA